MQVLPANRGASEWNLHVVRTAEATGLSGKDGLFKVAAATYRTRRDRLDNRLDGVAAGASGLLGGEDPLLDAAGEMAAALADPAGPALRWRGAGDAWEGASAAGNGSYASVRPQPGGEEGSGTAEAKGEGSGGAGNGRSGGRRRGTAAARKDIPVAGNIREEIDGW